MLLFRSVYSSWRRASVERAGRVEAQGESAAPAGIASRGRLRQRASSLTRSEKWAGLPLSRGQTFGRVTAALNFWKFESVTQAGTHWPHGPASRYGSASSWIQVKTTLLNSVIFFPCLSGKSTDFLQSEMWSQIPSLNTVLYLNLRWIHRNFLSRPKNNPQNLKPHSKPKKDNS